MRLVESPNRERKLFDGKALSSSLKCPLRCCCARASVKTPPGPKNINNLEKFHQSSFSAVTVDGAVCSALAAVITKRVVSAKQEF